MRPAVGVRPGALRFGVVELSGAEGRTMSKAIAELGRLLPDGVVMPADAGWEDARLAWNLTCDQRACAVVFPQSAQDMLATVKFAAAHGLRIAFNAGGHNAGPIDWSEDTLLVKTERMRGIQIDGQARSARVESGVLAKPLAEASADHGLSFLAGTSPDAGLAGYLLGGGFSWMLRKYGFACNSVSAIELVTADGRLVTATRDSEPELFWALRGGGGSFGAVTAFEMDLLALDEIYAGCLFWPIERAAEILGAWREWVDSVPLECTSIGRMLQLPDVPFLPEHLRGRSFVLIEPAFIGSQEEGERLVAPLRALGPEIDTVAPTAMRELSVVNMDPEFPLPYHGDGVLLSDCDAATIDAAVAAFVGSPLVHTELRHLGGAASISSPDHGALDAVEAQFLSFSFGMAPDPDAAASVLEHVELLLAALGPWDSGQRYMNLTESRVEPSTLFSPASYQRLCTVKARYDPDRIFQANHPIPCAA
jgi:hypothetical protein